MLLYIVGHQYSNFDMHTVKAGHWCRCSGVGSVQEWAGRVFANTMRTAVPWLGFDSDLRHSLSNKKKNHENKGKLSNLFFLSVLESGAEVCLRHWCHHLPWSVHPWYIHQSDPGSFQGAPPPDCDRPSCRPSATDWGFLRQHPHHCPVQHWLPTEIRGHCHPL